MIYFVEVDGELVVVYGEDPRVACVLFGYSSVDDWRLPLPAWGSIEGNKEVLGDGRSTAMDLLPMVRTLVTVIW